MKHVWVAIQYAVVDVVENPETGNLDWSVTEAADELGKDEAAVGCWICEEELNHATYNTECPGPPDGGTSPN
jgi:hypothetical protein